MYASNIRQIMHKWKYTVTMCADATNALLVATAVNYLLNYQ